MCSSDLRVTIAIEPAVDRLVRANDWLGGSFLLRSLGGRGRSAIHQVVYDGAWVVDVETDSGQRVRVSRADHSCALELAKVIWRDVRARGVEAVADLS